MLTPKDYTSATMREKLNDTFGEIIGVVALVGFILSGCQTSDGGSTKNKKLLQEPQITNPALAIAIKGGENRKSISTEIPPYNSIGLPKLRGPIQELPIHTYEIEDSSLKKQIDDLGKTKIGDAEISFFRDGIVKIVVAK